MNKEIDISILKEVLDYCPDTGILTWKERPLSMFKDKRHRDAWNNNFVGKKAGSVYKSVSTRGTIYPSLAVSIFRVRYRAHRVAWALHYGVWPSKDKEIDHINGDSIDNRICNLRLVSKIENMRNMASSGRNTSGCIGVSFCNYYKKWIAQIGVGKKSKKRLGYFKTKEEAIKARKQAEIDYNYHENHGRDNPNGIREED